MTRSMQAVVLFGGGLDAGAMVELEYQAHQNKRKLHLLYVDYGAKASYGEIDAMHYFAEKYAHDDPVLTIPRETFPPNPITDSPMTSDHKDDYLPGRNLLLAALAFPLAVKLKAPEIWFGAAPTDDPYMLQWARDMQQPFVDGFNITTAFAYGIDTPRFKAPLLAWPNKKAYVRQAMVTEPALFEHTFSCYQSTTLAPCGVCAHCLYRNELHQQIRTDVVVSREGL